ncbi:hypothetical protein [Tsuneonella aeria]|uniref:hypothetical protein n=1 Tax=Tsuneonella aeria TaxID=1837929 RepID=UPI00136BFE49|nr:hypothetical protein [Tsuneonella aeria]
MHFPPGISLVERGFGLHDTVADDADKQQCVATLSMSVANCSILVTDEGIAPRGDEASGRR